MSEEEPFGFTISRPGEYDLEYGDPDNWQLALPHRCGEWIIADGDRDWVLTEAKKFRAELDTAIAKLENAT